MSKRPEYHLQRIDDSGAAGPIEVHPVGNVPDDAHMGRRGFLGAGVGISAVIASLGTTRSAKAAPAPGGVYAHEGRVSALEFSPDGKTLVSASHDGTIKFWRLTRAGEGDQGNVVDIGFEHDGPINDLALGPDGKTVYTVSDDRTLRSWNLEDGTPGTMLERFPAELVSVAAERQVGAASLAVAYATSPKVDHIVVTRLRKGTGPGDPFRSTSSVRKLAFLPDGRLASAEQSKRVQVYDTARGQKVADLPGPNRWVECIAVSPSGRWLASGDYSGKAIVLTPLAKPDRSQRLAVLSGRVNDLAFSAEGEILAAATAQQPRSTKGHTVDVFRIGDGLEVSLPCPFEMTSVAISPDGHLLAGGDGEGAIILWDLRTHALIGFLFEPESNSTDGQVFHVENETTGFVLSFTLPCGAPIPASATCTCNCVPGTFVPSTEETITEVPTTVKVPRGSSKEEDPAIREARRLRSEQFRVKRAQKVALQRAVEQQRLAQTRAAQSALYLEYLRRRYGSSYGSGSSSTTCTCNKVCTCIPVSR